MPVALNQRCNVPAPIKPTSRAPDRIQKSEIDAARAVFCRVFPIPISGDLIQELCNDLHRVAFRRSPWFESTFDLPNTKAFLL